MIKFIQKSFYLILIICFFAISLFIGEAQANLVEENSLTIDARSEGNMSVIYLIDISNNTEKIVASEPSSSLWLPSFSKFITLSPNNNYVAYITADNLFMQNAQLWLVELETMNQRLLAVFNEDFWVSELVWSSDESKIAFVKQGISQPIELWMIYINSGEQSLVVSDDSFRQELFRIAPFEVIHWSEDGDFIYYIDYFSDLGFQTEYSVDLHSGGANQVRINPNDLDFQDNSIFTALPCGVSQFSQNDPQWSGQVMQTCGSTIGAVGCAVTSTSMVFRYYGVSTDPGSLNQCLGNNACPLYWEAASSSCSSGKVSFLGATGFSWSSMEAELNAGRPPILGMSCPSYTHFVVVTSGSGSSYSNYTIIDPWDGQIKNLSSYGSCSLTGLRKYSGTPWCQGGGSCDATSVPAGYIKCAEEGEYCSFSGTKQVYYGANSCYTVQTHTDGVNCSNDVFGDPLDGVHKACYIEETTPQSNCNDITWDGTYFFNQDNCSGAGLGGTGTSFFNATDYSSSECASGTWNDCAESIYVKSGWSVRVFQHTDAYGATSCISGSKWDLNQDTYDTDPSRSMNQDISSYQRFQNSSCYCTNNVEFLGQSPYPTVDPGQNFQIYFDIRNPGTCIWRTPDGYYLDGFDDLMGANPTQDLTENILPGQSIRFIIDLTAPTTPGLYRTSWMMSKNGSRFGPWMFIDVTVRDTTPSDDNYEENDTMATSYDLSSDEQVWLSSIDGYGIQSDDDWYRIFVTSGYERLQIEATFTHTEGDIDIALYNASGTNIAASTSTTDNETIDYVVPEGGTFYYIKVYYADAGNQYDLWWDDIQPSSSSIVINEINSGTPDAVELYNYGSSVVDLSGWVLETYDATDSIENSYTIPNGVTLAAGAYLVIEEYGNPLDNTSSWLYIGSNINWTDSGAVSLSMETTGIDFMRFGGSTVSPPSGTSWTGTNPIILNDTLGRDSSSTDTDNGSDWCLQSSSMGTQNSACLIIEPDLYEPDDDSTSANWITSGSDQTHNIYPVGDEDWVMFTLSAESEVIIETSGPSGDTQIWLYDSSLTEIEYNDDGGTNTFSYIDRVCGTDALPAGSYYVKVDDYGDNSLIPTYTLSYNASACNSPPAPEISVEYYSNGVEIIDGDTTPSTSDGTDFGDLDITSGILSRWFRIWNYGDAALNLTGSPVVAISGCSGFSISTQPWTTTVGIGDSSVLFEVVFNPSTAGDCTASISIANDDSDENPYTFNITGAGIESGFIFEDNFETGDLSLWSRVNDSGGFLYACTDAAINGSYGVCVARGDNDKRKQLTDLTPVYQTSFSTQFGFDINSLQMGQGERFRFMQVKMDQERPFFLVVKYDSGQYWIQLNTKLDDLSKVKSDWILLTDAPHTIEVNWQVASSNGANNGFAELYIDDLLVAALTGLDNDTLYIDKFKLGFTSTLYGKDISGIFYLDDVYTSNNGYIGVP